MAEAKSTTTQSVTKNALHTPPNDEPPPNYAVNDENTLPDITAAFSNLKLGASGKPTVDHCIVHLKLLEAFHQLREDVALQDGLFGLEDGFVPPTLDERQRTELLTKIREKRWAVFVAKAAQRFETWWAMVIEPSAEKLEQKDIPTAFREKIHIGRALSFAQDHLPPLGQSQAHCCCSISRDNTNIICRCHHGVARLPAESSWFPGRLSSLW